MKSLIKFSIILSFLVATSCSSTKSTLNAERDGSSFEKAIIVNSIAEEYEYTKKVCPNCKFLGQSLVFHEKKPYDILKYKKPNGKTVSYHFDISSFFGKGF